MIAKDEYSYIRSIIIRLVSSFGLTPYKMEKITRIDHKTIKAILDNDYRNLSLKTLNKLLTVKALEKKEIKVIKDIINKHQNGKESLKKIELDVSKVSTKLESEFEKLKEILVFKEEQLKQLSKEKRSMEEELLKSKQASYNQSTFRNDVTMKARIESNIINIDRNINELEYNLKTSNEQVIDYFINNNVFEHNIGKLEKAIEVFEKYIKHKKYKDVEIV